MNLITVPSSTQVLTDTTTWSSALFTALLGIGLLFAGVLIGGMIVSALIGALIRGVSKVTGKGRGGRRRRR